MNPAIIQDDFLETAPPPCTTKRKHVGEEKRKRKNMESMKIFNISTHTLSTEETSLLSKGLTFAPTTHPNPFMLFKDLNTFIRDLTVKRFYNIKSSLNPPPPEEIIEIIKSDAPGADTDSSASLDLDVSIMQIWNCILNIVQPPHRFNILNLNPSPFSTQYTKKRPLFTNILSSHVHRPNPNV